MTTSHSATPLEFTLAREEGPDYVPNTVRVALLLNGERLCDDLFDSRPEIVNDAAMAKQLFAIWLDL